jgi:hypothetical protein
VGACDARLHFKEPEELKHTCIDDDDGDLEGSLWLWRVSTRAATASP